MFDEQLTNDEINAKVESAIWEISTFIDDKGIDLPTGVSALMALLAMQIRENAPKSKSMLDVIINSLNQAYEGGVADSNARECN